jgi:hypothetical protein
MSDDEKYQIIGKVVSDHEEAKKHLAALFAKVDRLKAFLNGVGHALDGRASLSVAGDKITVRIANMSDNHTEVWPSWGDLAALMQEIKDTNQRIETLETQRKGLGV